MSYYYSTTNPNPSSSHSVSSSSSSFQNNGKEKKKRGTNNGVKLSTDPQSVAARERRHRISDRFKILQSLVPGGSKMDTVSMLEEAINYVKFLKTQIWLHNLMSVMDEDPYNNNNNNNNNDDVVYLPSNSANVLPQQPPFYLDAEIEAEMQRSLQLPDSSFFQGEAMVGHDPFDKARYL